MCSSSAPRKRAHTTTLVINISIGAPITNLMGRNGGLKSRNPIKNLMARVRLCIFTKFIYRQLSFPLEIICRTALMSST